jgi:hypothetical protein
VRDRPVENPRDLLGVVPERGVEFNATRPKNPIKPQPHEATHRHASRADVMVL